MAIGLTHVQVEKKRRVKKRKGVNVTLKNGGEHQESRSSVCVWEKVSKTAREITLRKPEYTTKMCMSCMISSIKNGLPAVFQGEIKENISHV